MQIDCLARQDFPCPPQAVFDLMVDTARFPATFRGYGLIPAIRAISLQGPLAVGATRRIENADGSVLTERVDALAPPSHHAYTLTGFRAPFSWLVTRGAAEWVIAPRAGAGPGSSVSWRYRFTLTGRLAYAPAALILHLFMARAMRRCLARMALILEQAPQQTPRHAPRATAPENR
jgi:hypothetical protein